MKTLVILAEKLDNVAQDSFGQMLEPCFEDDICLDASGVKMVGARCLELIFSAARTSSDNKTSFYVDDPSPEFAACLKTLGTSVPDIERKGSGC